MAMITFPAAADVIASTTEYSAPFFTEFIGYIWYILAIAIAVAVVIMIRRGLISGMRKVTGTTSRRRSGRRR